ncbi:ROK family protein [Sulfurimonas sp. C5]|uniref:ROK family protein n=1 Tax=Sulfurimonas sp. C5 TaxID=3036947 RepID=UPI002455C936|nr:ROK family protein [Sulfurimonas sp. C5]MDH4944913.1 ROK family protein [Sulfurimonas sp. C5]
MKLCIDAGGTYFRYALFEGKQEISSGSDKCNGIGFIPWIEKLLQRYKDVKTIAVGYAGQVKKGIILGAPNIEVTEPNIKNYFQSRYDVEFLIQNDLSCAVLAEANYFQTGEICALYVGSGLGLGVITNGSLLKGNNALAGELGHIPYKKVPFVCGCGKDNCIELFASGSGFIKFKRYLQIDEDLTLQELRDSTLIEHTELYKEFEEALLHAVGVVITLFNPEILVLGGGIIADDETIFETVTTRYKEFSMPQSTQGLRIVKTKLQNAVLQGASLLKEDQ